jgi:hypothetical protein
VSIRDMMDSSSLRLRETSTLPSTVNLQAFNEVGEDLQHLDAKRSRKASFRRAATPLPVRERGRMRHRWQMP